jgi:multidrug efflux pump subunit AcrA (membrane-fusion protein)
MKLKPSRRTGTIIKLALAAAVVVVIAYRLKFAPLPVLVHEIRSGSIAGEVMGTGTLEARVKTTISPRIQERLAEVLVDQNDRVETGQLLARLDGGELKLQVEAAEAALAAARATTERVRVDEARAQAVEKQSPAQLPKDLRPVGYKSRLAGGSRQSSRGVTGGRGGPQTRACRHR